MREDLGRQTREKYGAPNGPGKQNLNPGPRGTYWRDPGSVIRENQAASYRQSREAYIYLIRTLNHADPRKAATP